MASKVKSPARSKKISYALMAHFSELLICGRCFRHNERTPVRQLMSTHHRPLALCHDCSHEVMGEQNARVLHMN